MVVPEDIGGASPLKSPTPATFQSVDGTVPILAQDCTRVLDDPRADKPLVSFCQRMSGGAVAVEIAGADDLPAGGSGIGLPCRPGTDLAVLDQPCADQSIVVLPEDVRVPSPLNRRRKWCGRRGRDMICNEYPCWSTLC